MRPIQGSWRIQEALQNDIGINDFPKVEDMPQPMDDLPKVKGLPLALWIQSLIQSAPRGQV